MVTEGASDNKRGLQRMLAGYWISIVCIAMGIPLAIVEWVAGGRVYPKLTPLDDWEVVLDASDAKVESAVAIFTYHDGVNGGFVIWRSEGNTYIRRGVGAGITQVWPKTTTVQLSGSQSAPDDVLDTLLKLRNRIGHVSGRRVFRWGRFDCFTCLIYMRDGSSEWKFYLDPDGDISPPEWRTTLNHMIWNNI
jgi:hypothetical protein